MHLVYDLRDHVTAGRQSEARAVWTTLAQGWLAPAALGAINQDIERSYLLELFGLLRDTPELQELKARVEAAPEPEVMLPEGDFF